MVNRKSSKGRRMVNPWSLHIQSKVKEGSSSGRLNQTIEWSKGKKETIYIRMCIEEKEKLEREEEKERKRDRHT